MNWNGLLKIEYANLTDKDNNIIFEWNNIKNILHKDGEEFILKSVFLGGTSNIFIPSSYFLGLDSRVTINREDKLINLVSEPTGNGYFRRSISSSNEFIFNESNLGVSQALTPIVTFSASGGSYSATNLFLCTSLDNNGFLISSVKLKNPLTIDNGQSFNLRMSLSLRDCP